jgi:hypothetical protein
MMAFDEFVMLPECRPGPLLPLCALGRIGSASCRCVHVVANVVVVVKPFVLMVMLIGSPVCWPRFCSFPMCFEGFCPPVWASGRCLPCCGRCCGHGLARQIRHVAGVLSRCGFSSRCFRSQTAGLLPLCTLSWLRSLPLSGLLYPSCSYGRRSIGPVLFFPNVF